MVRWVECPCCGHKLFKWIEGDWVLEVKCPSCKKIMVLRRQDNAQSRPVQ